MDHGAASDPKHSLTLRNSTCVPFRGRDRADFPYAVSDRADLFSSSRSQWITNAKKTVFPCLHGRLFWGAYSTKNNHERGAGACLQSLLPLSQGNRHYVGTRTTCTNKSKRPKTSNTDVVVLWDNAPATATSLCNAVLTEKSSVKMWLLTHQHTSLAGILIVPCMRSPYSTSPRWICHNSGASDQQGLRNRAGGIGLLIYSACPRFTCVARSGWVILVILVRLPSDLQVIHGRRDREGNWCC